MYNIKKIGMDFIFVVRDINTHCHIWCNPCLQILIVEQWFVINVIIKIIKI